MSERCIPFLRSIALHSSLLASCAALSTAGGIAFAGEPLGDCGASATRIHEIQGSGRSSPLLGRRDVVVEAVVVGTFPGFPIGLGGFFVQEEDSDSDGDPTTSEGLFVFDGGLGSAFAVGDRVRIRGSVSEFFGLTELAQVSGSAVCSPAGSASAAQVRLPVPDPKHWERWEGMRVRLEQRLVATGHHGLARFGEIVVAANDRLWQPTHRTSPGAAALEWAERNARHRILLDDGSDARDPEPIPHIDVAGGRTLRLGDSLNELEGVLDFAFGHFRIHPTEPVRFEPVSVRPEAPPTVRGTLRVVAWNLANYFNGDGRGGGFPTRGARNAAELERQRAKLVATLVRMDPDVAALVELENDGAGPASALGELVQALNERTHGAPYAAIEPSSGELGEQAIAVGLLYRPSAAAPLGDPAILDAHAHPNFDAGRNRPSLAQIFEAQATGERVTVVVNHFKSKGSPCDGAGDPDLGDGQGDCNATRRRAASALIDWLGAGPVRGVVAPILILGDLNAYPQEDPVRAIEAAGFVDLLAWFAGPDAHTFVFDGTAGRLDHALASADLLPEVGGAVVWHTNSDEPRLLDYRLGNPPEGYAPDPFRASDHDPVLVGLFPDGDGDGLTDARDACPSSAIAATVTLADCDSGAPERLDASGCTLTDQLLAISAARPPRSGRMREAGAWLAKRVDEGTVARRDRGDILACVARLGRGQ